MRLHGAYSCSGPGKDTREVLKYSLYKSKETVLTSRKQTKGQTEDASESLSSAAAKARR